MSIVICLYTDVDNFISRNLIHNHISESGKPGGLRLYPSGYGF